VDRWLRLLFIVALLWPLGSNAQTAGFATSVVPPPIILTVEGTNVWVQRFRSNVWESAFPQQVLRVGDRGRTGADSRTSIRLSDLSVLRIGWHSEFEIQPLPVAEVEAEFSLWRGLLRLLNRDRPGKHRFVTPTATAATRGTEFVLKVEERTGRTTLMVFEGEAELNNAQGSVRLVSGEQGIAVAGRAPTKTAVIDATAIVQWCLYYPGVLDLNELPLTVAEEAALSASLAEYRSGGLLRALSAYPSGRTPASDSERVYLAALLLAVGQVEQSESLLDTLEETDPTARVRRLASALRRVVDVVNLRERPSTLNSQSFSPPNSSRSPITSNHNFNSPPHSKRRGNAWSSRRNSPSVGRASPNWSSATAGPRRHWRRWMRVIGWPRATPRRSHCEASC
jgi:hypothetical protein